MINGTITEDGSPRQFAEAMPDIVEAAAVEVVQLWHHRMMPGHFTEEGFDKYQMQPRKGQDEPATITKQFTKGTFLKSTYYRQVPNPHYFWKKYRDTGSRDPLVYTGKSKQMATSSIRINSREFKTRGSVRAVGVLNLPTYFYQIGKRNDRPQPDKANELTRVSADEEQELSLVMQRAVQAGIASMHHERVTESL